MIRLGSWAFGKKTIKVKFPSLSHSIRGTCYQICLITSELNLDQLVKQCLPVFSIVKGSHFLKWNFNVSDKKYTSVLFGLMFLIDFL